MIILGVDPGTICTGYGVIKYVNNELIYVASGIINTPKTEEMPPRLESIYDNLAKVIKKNKPNEFALETAFYGKNVQSTLKIGYARGVSMLVAAHHGLKVSEYAPREIKKAVVGKGSSTKEQVQFMVKTLTGVDVSKMKLDETDAIAVAICHALNSGKIKSKGKSWKSFADANPDLIIE